MEEIIMSIRVGILGYGNLGRGVECAIKHNPDMELKAVFTRRDPETVKILTESAGVYSIDAAESMKDEIDVLIICGGSATDLPVQTPKYAQWFNVVDSFDTHAKIPEHFANVDAAASKERPCWNYLCWLGSGNVFPEPDVCQCHSDGWKRLHLLGQGREPGTFRCHPPY